MQPQSEVSPSRNRGEGYLTPKRTRTLRNKLSNTQTSSKKKKVENEMAEELGKSLTNVACLIGGPGLGKAAYCSKRHIMAPKGALVSIEKRTSISKCVDGDHVMDASEAFFLRNQPEYIPVPKHQQNVNCSAYRFSEEEWVLKGFKGDFRGNVEFTRGKRMSDYGVNMLNIIEQELRNQYNEDWVAAGSVGPAPQPPTDGEIKAAVQLSIFHAWNNRNKTHFNRKEVNNDLEDLEI